MFTRGNLRWFAENSAMESHGGLVGGLFSPIVGMMIQSDELHHSSGWLNHQPEDFPRKNMYGSWAISHCVFDYQRVGQTPGITWV